MIERKFLSQKIKEKQIQDYITSQLSRASHSKVEIKRTPLGERIIIYTSRPGLIVGRKGENITKLTTALKTVFHMSNPQIEIGEIDNINLDPHSIADRIAYTLERYGPRRFKFTGYNTLSTIMQSGAMGAEIIIGGAGVPGARSKSWRFSAGYLKKSGDIADHKVLNAQTTAHLKRASVGIKVSIMPSDIILPDKIVFKNIEEIKVEEIKVEEIKEEKPKPKKITKKKKEENGNNKEEGTKATK
tara:strand:+ start:28885 stop:29616 length:732 start_codon:yes stop_codon:yes gene_type:complete